jgi:predicted phosphodiesterase
MLPKTSLPSAAVGVLGRVGVIGDIHCEDELLQTVLEHFVSEGAATMLAVGDIVDGIGDANRVCELLTHREVFTVKGNHDRWILNDSMRGLRNATPLNTLRAEMREWLARLPTTLSFKTPKGELLLCHGIGEDDMAMLRQDDAGYALEFNLALSDLLRSTTYSFIVNGHSHEAMVRTIGKLTIINAGTLARGGRQTCSLVDFESGWVDCFDVCSSGVLKAERHVFNNSVSKQHKSQSSGG